MDQIYFWILILFFIILFLDYYEKRNKTVEKYEPKIKNGQVSDSTIPPYFEENRLSVFKPVYSTNAVNISPNKNLNFRNFTTNGITPPFLKCTSCNLQYQCSDYPYEVSDKNESVCHNCFEKISYNSLNYPVYGRAVGKPRVCRNLK
jgi:hypothetical protein